MKKISIVITLNVLVFFSGASLAGRYWPPVLNDWKLSLNNGVAYISSSDFAEHCSHNRGQINMDGTEFNKAQYAYAMLVKARGKKLKYVVDRAQTTCVITGLAEVD